MDKILWIIFVYFGESISPFQVFRGYALNTECVRTKKKVTKKARNKIKRIKVLFRLPRDKIKFAFNSARFLIHYPPRLAAFRNNNLKNLGPFNIHKYYNPNIYINTICNNCQVSNICVHCIQRRAGPIGTGLNTKETGRRKWKPKT